MNLTEKQKWMVLSGLAPVLVVAVVLRAHQRRGAHRHGTKIAHAGGAEAVTTAPGNAAPDAAAAASPAVNAATSAASAVELARAFLERPSLDAVVPERDLFAPARGNRQRRSITGSAMTANGAENGNDEMAVARKTVDSEDPPADDAGTASNIGNTAARIEPPAPGPLSLTATFRDGAVRMAVLGGRLVKEGERVRGGYVLSRVEESRVTLTRGNDVLVVDMPSR